MELLEYNPETIKIDDSIVLNYVRAGSGPALIFIHGAMGDWRSWSPQWQLFTSYFDCISYSRRFSYPNPNPMNSYQHNALVDARDLEALMNQLGIEQAILVGSSYGGFTALALAVQAPERVTAVVSVEAPMMRYAQDSPKGASITKEFIAKSARPAREAFERGDDKTGVMLLTGGIVGKNVEDIPPEVLKRRMLNATAARSLALSEDEFPMLAKDCLASLTMPVMLISGADTAPIHAAIFEAVCAAMPKAHTCIVNNSGHAVSQQQSDTFNREVITFLASSGLTESTSS